MRVNISPWSLRLSGVAMFLLLALLPARAYDGKQVNAKAVSVQSFYTGWFSNYSVCGSSDGMFDGSIYLYTIEAAKVTNKTLLYDRSLGLAEYPAFNLAGTKVAFYREGRAPTPGASNGSCTSVTGGKSHISVINSDGTGLTDLFELPVLPQGGIFPLDWPAGDWIYFEMPHTAVFTNQGNTSLMIWRVNAVTKVAERVCNLTDNGSGAEIVCSYIHRFSLSIAGDKMALMLYPKNGCDTDVNFIAVNNIFPFPPVNGNLNNPPNQNLNGSAIGGRAGCNISISPSGTQIGSYFAGNHDDLFLNNTNIKISQLESWSGEEIGNGAEVIRWAANSDKWVLQGIGFINSGHASSNILGCNSVVCNWVDQVAINISKNVPAFCGAYDYMTCGVPPTLEQSIMTSNDPGDMWISDPANNPNGNKYEDLQGVWHSVNLPSVSPDNDRIGMRGGPNVALALNQADRDLALRLPLDGFAQIKITDIRGATIARHAVGGGLTHVSLKRLAAGTYFVTVSGAGTFEVSRIVLR